MEDELLRSVRNDDLIEYFLFTQQSFKDNKEDELSLVRLKTECNNIIKKYLANYLWHKEGFKLNPRTAINGVLNCDDDQTPLPSHLYGVTDCGENIDDEWFIVYLLVELTKEIEGLVVRVIDIDGEFLLIEAADYLPSWANPETCDKRVYLYNGLVHIVAPEETDSFEPIAISEAIKEIRKNPALTVASVEIQNSIKNKIKDYPGAITENLHRATAYLPVAIAAMLNQKPNLISPAIQAFCNRDTIDMKACRAMKYFPPENRVNSRVTFSKHLYAMLTHSKFVPDRKIGWNLPPVNNPSYKPHLLGVKIACGFEILLSQIKPLSLDSDKGWNLYLEKLKSTNYFKGLLEHSKEYNELFNKAKEHYLNNKDGMQVPPAAGEEILALMKNLEYNVEDLKKVGEQLPADDDESWLNISPEDLEKMLQEKYGPKKMFSFNKNSNPVNFTEKMTEFLEHISSVDGAEFPSPEDASPVRPPRGIKNKQKSKVSFSSDTKSDSKINFDPNAFSCAVQNILNFVIPEDDSWNLDSDSDMSDYGKEDTGLDSSGDLKTKMEEYIKQMDQELANTTIGESFETSTDKFEDVESFKPVDIDMNALKNILESYKSQLGEAGPSSNMLGPMGIHLDAETSEAPNEK